MEETYRRARTVLLAGCGLLALAALLLAARFPWMAGVAGALALLAFFRRPPPDPTCQGSARWADLADLERAGMLQTGNGVLAGTVDGRPSRAESVLGLLDPGVDDGSACERFLSLFGRGPPPRQEVRLNDAVHVSIFAPAGAGKNRSIAFPWLAGCTDSMFVIDVKGENHLNSARRRQEAMGHRIIRIDPWEVCGPGGNRLNLISHIDPADPEAIDRIKSLVAALVVRPPDVKEPFFYDLAEIFLCGAIAFVLCYLKKGHPDRSLQGIRKLLSASAGLDKAVAAMQADPVALHGGIALLGGQMASATGRTRDSIIATVHAATSWLDSPAIAAVTGGDSDFSPSELIHGKATAYVIVPPAFLSSHAGMVRAMLTAFLDACVANGAQREKKVRFLLDEMATAVGRLEVVNRAIALYRGYGVSLCMLWQSMGQLKPCFPEDEGRTLLGNCTCAFFGTNDLETAKHISERGGKGTIVMASGGSNTGWSRSGTSSSQGGGSSTRGVSGGQNDNWQYHGRELLTVDEVLATDPRIAFVLVPGMRPVWTTLCRHDEPRPGAGGAGGTSAALARSWWFLACAAIIVLAVACAIGRPARAAGTARPRPGHRATGSPIRLSPP